MATQEPTIAGDTVNATIAVTAADLVVVANGLTAVDGSMAAGAADHRIVGDGLTAGAEDRRTMAEGLTAGAADHRTVAEGLTAGARADHLMVAAMITVDHPMLTAARTAVATITNTTDKLGLTDGSDGFRSYESSSFLLDAELIGLPQ